MERLLTQEQAAEYLAVSPQTINKWLNAGKLKGVRIGRLWRIRERDLEAFLEPERQEIQQESKKRTGRKER